MDKNFVIVTPRLGLRELVPDDAAFIVRLVNSEGWLRFIGDRNVHSEEDGLRYIATGPLKSYRENGFGLWLVETLHDNHPVGLCGLLKRDYLSSPDLGFALSPGASGQGFAGEAAGAVLRHATEVLRLPAVAAIVMAENVRSVRLLSRLGFERSGVIVPPGSAEKLELFSFPARDGGR